MQTEHPTNQETRNRRGFEPPGCYGPAEESSISVMRAANSGDKRRVPPTNSLEPTRLAAPNGSLSCPPGCYRLRKETPARVGGSARGRWASSGSALPLIASLGLCRLGKAGRQSAPGVPGSALLIKSVTTSASCYVGRASVGPSGCRARDSRGATHGWSACRRNGTGRVVAAPKVSQRNLRPLLSSAPWPPPR